MLGAAPTGDAPTTSEWSTILLPTKACLILEVWGYINSLTPGRCSCNLKLIIFKLMSRIDVLSLSCEIVLRWMPHWWFIKIGSDNGLVPPGNKPLPEPDVDPDLDCHMASLGHNEITQLKSFLQTHLFLKGSLGPHKSASHTLWK